MKVFSSFKEFKFFIKFLLNKLTATYKSISEVPVLT
jgi:hypothetical protein